MLSLTRSLPLSLLLIHLVLFLLATIGRGKAGEGKPVTLRPHQRFKLYTTTMEKLTRFTENKRYKLNMAALITIVTMFMLTYCITDVAAKVQIQMPLIEESEPDTETITKSKKKNIIMMVTDGTGPSSFNMARYYNQYINNLQINDTLVIDKYLIGQSRTRSSDSLITDSAAGATAFSCALKSYNGAIGVDADKNPCFTVLEGLKEKGYKTGLVVTTSLTDATPAAFSAHVSFRSMQDLIASQQLGINTTYGIETPVDLMIGGGRCLFLPHSHDDGCRSDELNLVEYARKQGYEVSIDKEGFDKLQLGKNEDIKLPIMSLLAYYNMPYDIDRNECKFPSLYEETITALNILSRETADSDEGFFLLVEGSRIDHAGHHNDAHAQVREVLAYDRAFEAVIDFAKNSEVETYVISTSDHETGGVAIGRQITAEYPDYIWYPEILANAKHSGEYINFKIDRYLNEQKRTVGEVKKYIVDDIIVKDLGILDYEGHEVKEILNLLQGNNAKGDEDATFESRVGCGGKGCELGTFEVAEASLIVEYLKDMVSRRARIDWSTHGHTAADVNIYGFCNRAEGLDLLRNRIGGLVENTEIGRVMAEIGEISLF